MGDAVATEADHLPLVMQERPDKLSADNAAGPRDQRDVVLLSFIHGVSPEWVTDAVSYIIFLADIPSLRWHLSEKPLNE